MEAECPTIVGLGQNAYDRWLWRELRRVLSLRVDPAVAICWGADPPDGAKAAVIIPRAGDQPDKPEALVALASALPGAELTVARAGIPVVRLDTDVLGWFGWFVSRAEEYSPFDADAHGRFPRSMSLAEKLALTDRPIADLLVARLRRAVELAANAAGLSTRRELPWPEGKRFAVCLTHDVDVAVNRSFLSAGRKLVGAIASLVTVNFPRARRRFSEAADLILPGRHRPYWLFEALVETEQRRGFRSAFYLMPYRRIKVREAVWGEWHYDVRRPALLRVFRRLAERGWELGTHTSYDAHDRPGGLGEDWRRLGEALGPEVQMAGARSHYLRFRVPQTWLESAECGMQYDATLGWAEGSGFRSGTCWPHRPFDRHAGKPIDIWEMGMHLMDTPMPDVESMIQAARRVLDCAGEAGGCACFLIHSCSTFDITTKEFLTAYGDLLDVIAARRDAWVATPQAVVARLNEHEG